MSMSDPLGDMLTRIRNAQRAKKTEVISPASRLRENVLEVLKKDKRILKTPAPSVFVASMADSAVVLTVRFWTHFADMLPTAADINEQLYMTLPKKKIHFPFPQMDVHIVK